MPCFTFECNPLCLEVCRHNATLTKNVTVVDKAAWDQDGTIPFYPIILTDGKIKDPGCSSCFLFTDNKLKRYSQGEITVPAIRLDRWLKENNILSVDMICMDT